MRGCVDYDLDVCNQPTHIHSNRTNVHSRTCAMATPLATLASWWRVGLAGTRASRLDSQTVARSIARLRTRVGNVAKRAKQKS